MKNIDFKNPRYVLPIICFPFILLLFYVFRTSEIHKETSEENSSELQTGISPVSSGVSGKGIEDKLQAFKQRYKKGDGYTALSTIELEENKTEEISSAYNQREKRLLDSISLAIKSQSRKTSAAQSYSPGADRYSPTPAVGAYARENSREELARILSPYAQGSPHKDQPKPADPMAIFRAQMAIVDSMNKASLPKAPVAAKPVNTSLAPQSPALKVQSQSGVTSDDYTIIAEQEKGEFIHGMVDESLTGFSGSRVRIRLSGDITAGEQRIRKGSLLYAQITGFSAQRVLLSITSIAHQGRILPVKLEVYDLDGIKGIYVPASAYREFKSELAAGSVSGLSLESSADQNQQLMSLLGRMFQSTTGAVNKMIRSNKAHLRYPTMVYLLDGSMNK